MTDIVWKAPPEHAVFSSQGQRGRYVEFAAALRARPGEWAVLPAEAKTTKSAQNTATNLRQGKMRGFDGKYKGRFETAVDGMTVYVRFLGLPDENPEGQEGAATDVERGDVVEEIEDGDELVPASEVRDWAIKQGIQVPERGRLPRQLRDQFLRAHGLVDANRGPSAM